MRYSYVRFTMSVGSPGRAGNDISSAKLRTPETTQSTSPDALMEDMFDDGLMFVLRAWRPVKDNPRRKYLAERRTPLTNCRDLEPAADQTPFDPDAPEPKKKQPPPPEKKENTPS